MDQNEFIKKLDKLKEKDLTLNEDALEKLLN
jgi:hypothetical protein